MPDENALSQSYSTEWNKSENKLKVVTEKTTHENISASLGKYLM